MWQNLHYWHVPPLLPLPHRWLLATRFTPCLPVWLPPLSSRDTLPSRDQFGPAAQDRQKRYRMRAKLLRCHLVVPASGAECSLWCQEVSLHLLFHRDGAWKLIGFPSQEQGLLRNLLAVRCALQHVISSWVYMCLAAGSRLGELQASGERS